MLSVLKLIALLGLVAVTVFRSLKVTRDARFRRIDSVGVNRGPLLFGVLAIVALLLLFPSIGYVSSGYRGVVLRFGAVTGRILSEGIYVVSPLGESVHEMSVQVEADAKKASASSKDLQTVDTEVTLNYALIPERVADVYQSLRDDYATRIIDPAIQEAVKAATARFNAEQLITERQAVRDAIEALLTARLSTHGIRIDAISLTNFAFSRDFTNAIEAKVTATQSALKAENDLRRIQVEAEQRIATARAEAEAIRIQAQSISAQGGDSYVALKWIEKWNGAPPSMMTGGSNSSLLFQVPRVGNGNN